MCFRLLFIYGIFDLWWVFVYCSFLKFFICDGLLIVVYFVFVWFPKDKSSRRLISITMNENCKKRPTIVMRNEKKSFVALIGGAFFVAWLVLTLHHFGKSTLRKINRHMSGSSLDNLPARKKAQQIEYCGILTPISNSSKMP